MRMRTLILIAAVSVVVLVVVYAYLSDNSIYRRSFGDHAIKIWISADDAGSVQQKIHASYYKRGFILMIAYNSVPLPVAQTTLSFLVIRKSPTRSSR